MNGNDWYIAKRNRDRWRLDNSVSLPSRGEADKKRIQLFASHASYPGWQFSITSALHLIAFRAHPETRKLQKLGPWPLPADAGEDEVLAAAMLAVAETDGPDAVARLEWLPAK